MNTHTPIFLVSLLIPILSSASYPLRHKKINLDSDDLIKLYLPQRLKSLTQEVKKMGVDQTAQALVDDPDLDSYLFIIEAQKPYRLLAYSRHPAWYDKTPDELQKIMFSKHTTTSIPQSLELIINAAHRSMSYIQYSWETSASGENQQIALVSLVSINGTSYVFGACVYAKRQYLHIMLPYNIEALIKRVHKEGLEKVVSIITHYNPNPERHFYIVRAKYPYRYVAYGNKPSMINMTPKERQEKKDPSGKAPGHDYEKRIQDLIDIAQHGGGFYAYIWYKPQKPEKNIHIAYTKMFVYKKKKYIMVAGYVPPISPKTIAQFESVTNNAYELFKKVGLGNTISLLKKTNTDENYVYVVNTTPPVWYALHQNPHFNRHTIPEIQAYLNTYGRSSVDMQAITKNNTKAAQRGGGWLAYEFFINPQKPDKGSTLKIALIKPFFYNKQLYYFGTGIGIDVVDD